MRYLCAGLFAEGRSDYAFLLRLLDQMLPALAASAEPGAVEIAASVGIDAPARTSRRRDARIAAAVRAYWDQCNLFIIHADGAGEPARAYSEQIAPGIALARAEHPDLSAAACVPVREIEAWLLARSAPFDRLLPTNTSPELPRDPEGIADPKRALRELLVASGGASLRGSDLYDFFGANVIASDLRRLPAFLSFEEDLARAVLAALR